MQRLPSPLLLLLLLLLLLNRASSAKIPALIVFGDSTVDTGNNNRIATPLKSNFPPYGRDFAGGRPTGRFCNGRLATDFASEALGLPATVPAYLDPAYGIRDFATGVCFASAGTGFDNVTSDVLSVIPLWKEVEYFKEYQRRLRRYMGAAKAEWTVNEAVYFVSIGTNDFLENYFLFVTGRFKQFTADEFQDFIVGLAADFLTGIYRLGARKISIAGLTPMGCLPLERTTNVMHGGACIEEYNEVAREFNVKLGAKIKELCGTLPGIRITVADPYDKLLDMINNPYQYGFDNVHEGCCGTGKFEMGYLCNGFNSKTCPDADRYLFWDSFHPTEKTNRIMSSLVLNSVAQLL